MPNKTSLPFKHTVTEPDRAAMRAIMNRRLVLRFGLSAHVAAVVAELANLGPREAR